MHKSNLAMKDYADKNHVKMWQIAKAYGVHEKTFCCKLREPLSTEDNAKIISIIDSIAKEQEV